MRQSFQSISVDIAVGLEHLNSVISYGRDSFTGDFNFWRYRDLLPKVRSYATLHEGGTPLYRAERLAKRLNTQMLKPRKVNDD